MTAVTFAQGETFRPNALASSQLYGPFDKERNGTPQMNQCVVRRERQDRPQ